MLHNITAEELDVVNQYRKDKQIKKFINIVGILDKEQHMKEGTENVLRGTNIPLEVPHVSSDFIEPQTQDNPADLAYYSDEIYARDFRAFTVHFADNRMEYDIGYFFKQPGGDYAGSLEVFEQPKATWLPPVLVAVYKHWDAVTFIRN